MFGFSPSEVGAMPLSDLIYWSWRAGLFTARRDE